MQTWSLKAREWTNWTKSRPLERSSFIYAIFYEFPRNETRFSKQLSKQYSESTWYIHFAFETDEIRLYITCWRALTRTAKGEKCILSLLEICGQPDKQLPPPVLCKITVIEELFPLSTPPRKPESEERPRAQTPIALTTRIHEYFIKTPGERKAEQNLHHNLQNVFNPVMRKKNLFTCYKYLRV